MKRKLSVLAGAAVLVVLVYVGSGLWAQQSGVQPTAASQPAAPPLKTRVALINLNKVVVDYKKCQAFREEMKTAVQAYEAQLQAKKKTVEGHQAEMAKATDAKVREQIEKQIKSLQREMQDISEDAKQTLAKKEGDQLVIIYKEIYQAAETYARSQDIEVVMHYNEAVSKDDFANPVNVQRKLSQNACFPLYMDPRIDITGQVVWMLNNYYERQTPGAGATAPRSN